MMTILLSLIAGYCIAVLFPIPGVNSRIIEAWKNLWDKIRYKL